MGSTDNSLCSSCKGIESSKNFFSKDSRHFQEGFSQHINSSCVDETLSDGAFRLLFFYNTFYYQGHEQVIKHFSISFIEKRLPFKRDKIIKCNQELEALGYVEIIREGDFQTPNVIHVLKGFKAKYEKIMETTNSQLPEEDEVVGESDQGVVEKTDKGVVGESDQGGSRKNRHNINISTLRNISKNNISIKPPIPPNGGDQDEGKSDSLVIHEVVYEWNKFIDSNQPQTKMLPKVKKSARFEKKLKQIKNSHPIQWFLELFNKLLSLEFYLGRNDKGWAISLDWILKNLDKCEGILERPEIKNETFSPKQLETMEHNQRVAQEYLRIIREREMRAQHGSLNDHT